jgi:DNA protecting protein DprA
MHIALSVMRGGVAREFCRVRDTVSAREFYDAVPLYERCRVAGHVAAEYGGDPVDVARRIIERAEARFVRIITPVDDAYPQMLACIPDPPLALYCIGRVPRGEMVSIVGTREASIEGIAAAHRLAKDFSSMGITVVSGMARGIDRAAHLGALDGGSGTVGVLAHGIDRRYPFSNDDLFSLMEQSALSSLVSEYPPGVRAGQWTFALRNRIISGLSRAVVVVQAGVRSGAMITARYAAEQGRDVYAVGGFPYDESFRRGSVPRTDGPLFRRKASRARACSGFASSR